MSEFRALVAGATPEDKYIGGSHYWFYQRLGLALQTSKLGTTILRIALFAA